MKVLQINAINGLLSTGRNTLEIADFLNDNGHECHIAYSEGNDYSKGYKIGTRFEKKAHALLSRLFGMQGYFSKNGTKKLLTHIDLIRPDIIHLGNLHGNYINLEMLLDYVRSQKIHLVLTLHDCWFYTGKCTHYTTDDCYNWKENCGKCVRLKKDNKSWIFDRTKRMLNDKKEWFSNIDSLTVIGVSDWITSEAEKSILSSANVIKRIYNWIDLDVFKPNEYNPIRGKYDLENKFIILGVASKWGSSKGLGYYIELSKSLPSDMCIILVGKIDSNLKIPSNVIHIDRTHDVNELALIYSTADVFLNFSFEESFGKVTAEALACGTPVMVMNSTASPELVGENCGYILENYDLTNILYKFSLIKQNGKPFYSQYCVDYANQKFKKDVLLTEHLDLYNSLCNGD